MKTTQLVLRLLALAVGLQTTMAHVFACKHKSKTRCMQEIVLNLKGELRVTQDCLRATQKRLDQQQRINEVLKTNQDSLDEELMLMSEKVGDNTTIAQDACVRGCKFIHCMLGNFSCFCRLLIVFKIYLLKKFFQEYHQNVKQF